MKLETEIVELGVASIETKGPGGPLADLVLGIFQTGLSDD